MDQLVYTFSMIVQEYNNFISGILTIGILCVHACMGATIITVCISWAGSLYVVNTHASYSYSPLMTSITQKVGLNVHQSELHHACSCESAFMYWRKGTSKKVTRKTHSMNNNNYYSWHHMDVSTVLNMACVLVGPCLWIRYQSLSAAAQCTESSCLYMHVLIWC